MTTVTNGQQRLCAVAVVLLGFWITLSGAEVGQVTNGGQENKTVTLNEDQFYEWSVWSPCSRTCGIGIQFKGQRCLRQNKKLCTVRPRKHQTCNTQACPTDVIDFRDAQCGIYNGRDIFVNGERAKWMSYIRDSNRCLLFCYPFGEELFYYFGRARDGTQCSKEPYGVCIFGRCKPVGCDNVLQSGVYRDKCRVCGGNSTTCEPIRGRVQRAPTQFERLSGYAEVLIIPKGSTSVTLSDNTWNYLALRRQNGEYAINGNRIVNWPGLFKIGEMDIEYKRMSDNIGETLQILGPTTEDLFVKSLLIASEVNVTFNFWKPIRADKVAQDVQDAEFPHYNIRHLPSMGWGRWTACSASCGGGIRVRARHCGTHSMSPCANGETEVQTCNKQPCDTMIAEWSEWGPWNSCSASCGGGARVRFRYCNKPSASVRTGCSGERYAVELCNVEKCVEKDATQSTPQIEQKSKTENASRSKTSQSDILELLNSTSSLSSSRNIIFTKQTSHESVHVVPSATRLSGMATISPVSSLHQKFPMMSRSHEKFPWRSLTLSTFDALMPSSPFLTSTETSQSQIQRISSLLSEFGFTKPSKKLYPSQSIRALSETGNTSQTGSEMTKMETQVSIFPNKETSKPRESSSYSQKTGNKSITEVFKISAKSTGLIMATSVTGDGASSETPILGHHDRTGEQPRFSQTVTPPQLLTDSSAPIQWLRSPTTLVELSSNRQSGQRNSSNLISPSKSLTDKVRPFVQTESTRLIMSHLEMQWTSSTWAKSSVARGFHVSPTYLTPTKSSQNQTQNSSSLVGKFGITTIAALSPAPSVKEFLVSPNMSLEAPTSIEDVIGQTSAVMPTGVTQVNTHPTKQTSEPGESLSYDQTKYDLPIKGVFDTSTKYSGSIQLKATSIPSRKFSLSFQNQTGQRARSTQMVTPSLMLRHSVTPSERLRLRSPLVESEFRTQSDHITTSIPTSSIKTLTEEIRTFMTAERTREIISHSQMHRTTISVPAVSLPSLTSLVTSQKQMPKSSSVLSEFGVRGEQKELFSSSSIIELPLSLPAPFNASSSAADLASQASVVLTTSMKELSATSIKRAFQSKESASYDGTRDESPVFSAVGSDSIMVTRVKLSNTSSESSMLSYRDQTDQISTISERVTPSPILPLYPASGKWLPFTTHLVESTSQNKSGLQSVSSSSKSLTKEVLRNFAGSLTGGPKLTKSVLTSDGIVTAKETSTITANMPDMALVRNETQGLTTGGEAIRSSTSLQKAVMFLRPSSSSDVYKAVGVSPTKSLGQLSSTGRQSHAKTELLAREQGKMTSLKETIVFSNNNLRTSSYQTSSEERSVGSKFIVNTSSSTGHVSMLHSKSLDGIRMHQTLPVPTPALVKTTHLKTSRSLSYVSTFVEAQEDKQTPSNPGIKLISTVMRGGKTHPNVELERATSRSLLRTELLSTTDNLIKASLSSHLNLVSSEFHSTESVDGFVPSLDASRTLSMPQESDLESKGLMSPSRSIQFISTTEHLTTASLSSHLKPATSEFHSTKADGGFVPSLDASPTLSMPQESDLVREGFMSHIRSIELTSTTEHLTTTTLSYHLKSVSSEFHSTKSVGGFVPSLDASPTVSMPHESDVVSEGLMSFGRNITMETSSPRQHTDIPNSISSVENSSSENVPFLPVVQNQGTVVSRQYAAGRKVSSGIGNVETLNRGTSRMSLSKGTLAPFVSTSFHSQSVDSARGATGLTVNPTPTISVLHMGGTKMMTGEKFLARSSMSKKVPHTSEAHPWWSSFSRQSVLTAPSDLKSTELPKLTAHLQPPLNVSFASPLSIQNDDQFHTRTQASAESTTTLVSSFSPVNLPKSKFARTSVHVAPTRDSRVQSVQRKPPMPSLSGELTLSSSWFLRKAIQTPNSTHSPFRGVVMRTATATLEVAKSSRHFTSTVDLQLTSTMKDDKGTRRAILAKSVSIRPSKSTVFVKETSLVRTSAQEHILATREVGSSTRKSKHVMASVSVEPTTSSHYTVRPGDSVSPCPPCDLTRKMREQYCHSDYAVRVRVRSRTLQNANFTSYSVRVWNVFKTSINMKKLLEVRIVNERCHCNAELVPKKYYILIGHHPASTKTVAVLTLDRETYVAEWVPGMKKEVIQLGRFCSSYSTVLPVVVSKTIKKETMAGTVLSTSFGSAVVKIPTTSTDGREPSVTMATAPVAIPTTVAVQVSQCPPCDLTRQMREQYCQSDYAVRVRVRSRTLQNANFTSYSVRVWNVFKTSINMKKLLEVRIANERCHCNAELVPKKYYLLIGHHPASTKTVAVLTLDRETYVAEWVPGMKKEVIQLGRFCVNNSTVLPVVVSKTTKKHMTAGTVLSTSFSSALRTIPTTSFNGREPSVTMATTPVAIPTTVAPQDKCGPCKMLTKRNKAYCASDFVIRAKILSEAIDELSYDTSYRVRLIHTFKMGRERTSITKVWVLNNVCRCPELLPNKEYILMGSMASRAGSKERIAVISRKSYVQEWRASMFRRMVELENRCAPKATTSLTLVSTKEVNNTALPVTRIETTAERETNEVTSQPRTFPSTAKPTVKCRRCRTSKKRNKSYCESDYVILANILESSFNDTSQERRYTVKIRRVFRNNVQLAIKDQEYLFVMDDFCQCPVLSLEQEYLIMGKVENITMPEVENISKPEARLVIPRRPFVTSWKPRMASRYNSLRGICDG